MKCLFTHQWSGCKCNKCGKTRDEGHDWSKDCEKCAKCGKLQHDVHNWVASECAVCGRQDYKQTLIEELAERLGGFAVNIFCAEINSLANARTCYNSFANAATSVPSKTTSFLGEILENKIHPAKGPVVGVICHDHSIAKRQESLNWFANYASRFQGLMSKTLLLIQDKNGTEILDLPICVYKYRHHY